MSRVKGKARPPVSGGGCDGLKASLKVLQMTLVDLQLTLVSAACHVQSVDGTRMGPQGHKAAKTWKRRQNIP